MKTKLSISELVVHQYLRNMKDDDGKDTVIQSEAMVSDLRNKSMITEAQVLAGLEGLMRRKLAYSTTDENGIHYGLKSE